MPIYIYTDENRIFFVRSPHHKHFGKAHHLVLWALWWHQLFSTRWVEPHWRVLGRAKHRYTYLSTLRHSCGLACQQRVLKTFPGPGYPPRGWGSLAMAFTSKFVYIINAHRLNIFNKNDKYVSSLHQKKYINLQSYNIRKLWFHNIILKCNYWQLLEVHWLHFSLLNTNKKYSFFAPKLLNRRHYYFFKNYLDYLAMVTIMLIWKICFRSRSKSTLAQRGNEWALKKDLGQRVFFIVRAIILDKNF